MKEEIEFEFDTIIAKIAENSLKEEDSKQIIDKILKKFTVEEIDQNIDYNSSININEEKKVTWRLDQFLENERKQCQDDQEYLSRDTKVSIFLPDFEGIEDVETIKRDFTVKTSFIRIDGSTTKPVFIQMFFDTTQITQLEETKAQFSYQRQMLANVSHEFRTPLNAMNMSLALLKDFIDPQKMKFHQIASSSWDILKGLVEGILDHSKIETGVFEVEEVKFRFEDLFQEVKSIFELQSVRKGIELKFDIAQELENINYQTDKQRLKQILLNLWSNALKFTDEGSIKVKLELSEAGEQMKEDLDEEIAGENIYETPNENNKMSMTLFNINYDFLPHSNIKKFNSGILIFSNLSFNYLKTYVKVSNYSPIFINKIFRRRLHFIEKTESTKIRIKFPT